MLIDYIWASTSRIALVAFFGSGPGILLCQEPSPSSLAKSNPFMLLEDKVPRDLGISRPNSVLVVQIPLLNKLDRDLVLIDTKASCSCTQVKTQSQLFKSGSETAVLLEIKTSRGDSNQTINVDLFFSYASDPTKEPMAEAHIRGMTRVRSDCSFGTPSTELRFDSNKSEVELFVANFGAQSWQNIRCLTGQSWLTARCFIKDDADVDGQRRQTAKIQLRLKDLPAGQDLNQIITLVVLAEFDRTRTAVEIGRMDFHVVQPKQFEIVPKQLYLSSTGELSFFAIANDESLSIADWKCSVRLGDEGHELTTDIHKVSPRWLKLRVPTEQIAKRMDASGKTYIEVVVSNGDVQMIGKVVVIGDPKN